MNATVLLVEDNIQLNEVNRRALELLGCRVLTALTLREARGHLAGEKPDVILLDVMLPDGDGIAFCGEIRSKTDAHILFLTSKTEDENKVRSLDTGGDDYITKPYKLEEMLARVRSALRRRAMHKNAPQSGRIEYGKLALDMVSGRAYWVDDDLKLTQKEFALLLLLVQNREKPLTKAYLYETVWNQPMIGDGNALFTQMSRLKKRLDQASGGAAALSLSRGEGYSLELDQC